MCVCVCVRHVDLLILSIFLLKLISEVLQSVFFFFFIFLRVLEKYPSINENRRAKQFQNILAFTVFRFRIEIKSGIFLSLTSDFLPRTMLLDQNAENC